MAALIAKELSKRYKNRLVIKNFNFNMFSGEIVGLLGPNGAGKTTTFYMLVGITKCDIGHIIIDDYDISLLPFYSRAHYGICYLPQESSIFRRLTVYENIMAVIQINQKKLTKLQRINLADKLMKEFHIDHLCNNLGQFLSGGERRRVEIARILATNPKFILLDEPFSGIDPLSVTDIKAIMKYLRDIGLGILITDHNVRETLSICQRAYIINKGQVIAHGTPESLLSNKTVRHTYLGENFEL